MKFEATQPAPGNFGNAPWPDGRPPDSHWPLVPPAVDLRRVDVGVHGKQKEEFELLQRITYDARLGEREVTVTVPQADGRFTTDLTSVPRIFTWLVPKSGAHLPAALVHDGLVLDRGGPQTYETSDGLPVDRIDADRIFRDAMRDTGVGLIRRWVVWSAVTIASFVTGPRPPQRWPWWARLYFCLVILATLGSILYLGLAATLDLGDEEWRWVWNLPWMAGPLWLEVLGGLAGAVVIPAALSVAWLRYWRAGAIAGVALATLVHVTLAVLLVAAAYQFAEWVTDGPRRARFVIGVTFLLAFAVFVWRLAACW